MKLFNVCTGFCDVVTISKIVDLDYTACRYIYDQITDWDLPLWKL